MSTYYNTDGKIVQSIDKTNTNQQQIQNVEIKTISKPLSQNLNDIKKLFVKGGSIIKEKLTPKKSNYTNMFKNTFSNSKKNNTTSNEGEDLNTPKTPSNNKQHIADTIKSKTDIKQNRKIEIEDDEEPSNIYEYNEDEEYEEEEEENDNVTAYKLNSNNNEDKTLDNHDSDENQNNLISDNRQSNFSTNRELIKKNEINQNLNDQFISIDPHSKNDKKEEMTIRNPVFMNKKSLEFVDIDDEDVDDFIHVFYQIGMVVDVSSYLIFPFKKLTKKILLKLFSKEDYNEENKYCFIDETFLYGCDDKVVKGRESTYRKIDLVIDLRLIYRILVYVSLILIISNLLYYYSSP